MKRPNMKAKLTISLVFFLAILGCKKENPTDVSNQKLLDQVRSAKIWIATNKDKLANSADKNRVDSLMSIAEWNSPALIEIHASSELLCIPLKSDSFTSFLVFGVKDEQIFGANVFVINKYQSRLPSNDLSILNSYFSNAKVPFDGELTRFSFSGKFTRAIGFENGVIKYVKEVTSEYPKNDKQTIRSNSNCTAFYLVTTFADAGNPCEQTSVIDFKTGENVIRSNCNGSGEGGGTPGESGDQFGIDLFYLKTIDVRPAGTDAADPYVQCATHIHQSMGFFLPPEIIHSQIVRRSKGDENWSYVQSNADYYISPSRTRLSVFFNGTLKDPNQTTYPIQASDSYTVK
ncbi:MAG: hypothetical protein RL596_1312 [Bacteroidota bacterium]